MEAFLEAQTDMTQVFQALDVAMVEYTTSTGGSRHLRASAPNQDERTLRFAKWVDKVLKFADVVGMPLSVVSLVADVMSIRPNEE